MTTDTLKVYDQLVGTGFTDAQARAMIPMIVARRRAESELLRGLEEILRKIDANHHLVEQLLENPQRFCPSINTTGASLAAKRGLTAGLGAVLGSDGAG